MRVAYFPNQCALNSIPVMQAILDSLRHAGHTCVENSHDADAAVIWSALWHGKMAPNKEIYELYRSQSKPVIIAEVGALYRGETWKVAVNHVNALGYYGHTENLDLDRPKKLGISLALNLSKNPAILIAAQHNHSLQLSGINQEDWILGKIRELKRVNDRPIVIRPHPRCPIRIKFPMDGVTLERPQKLNDTYDSYNLHFDYHAVVNYCSGPGIQAAISGTRPVVGPYSLAHPVSVSIDDLEKTYDIDRDQWLIKICHTEYTVKELAEGLWLQRLSPVL